MRTVAKYKLNFPLKTVQPEYICFSKFNLPELMTSNSTLNDGNSLKLRQN